MVVLATGAAAGAMNSVVGSGTLITFPTLLALGYPAVVANVSNTVGLVPGSLLGAYGYRSHLVGQRPLIARLALFAALGGLLGGGLLLMLPASVFRAAVPVLIGAACVLVAVQPYLSRRLAHRRQAGQHAGAALFLGVFCIAVYGGYFGGGQGVLLLGLMGVLLAEPLQRINGIKNILALTANLIAAVLFVAVSHVSWPVAGLIALGSGVGGHLGARFGRRLSPTALRGIIIAVGVVSVVRLA